MKYNLFFFANEVDPLPPKILQHTKNWTKLQLLHNLWLIIKLQCKKSDDHYSHVEVVITSWKDLVHV